MNMKKTTTVLSCAAALVLAGCSSGAVTAPHVASIASDVLQFNVGTVMAVRAFPNKASTWRLPTANRRVGSIRAQAPYW